MTQTEALKLALEALEYPGNIWHMNCPKDKAITAIKEALAQPEQEPIGWASDIEFDSLTTFCSHEEKGVLGTAGLKIPLYTTPPQRKPLTDDEILTVARNHYNPHQRAEISFARAIEAAHGIKE